MKKTIILLMFAVSGFMFSIDIKTAAQDSAPKFFMKSNKKEITGICIDVMRAIENIDSDIKFKGDQNFIPFKRIEVEVENGKLDCFVGFIKNEEREKKYIFVDVPIYYVKDILISRKEDKVEIKKMEEIKLLKDNIMLMVLGVGQTDKLKALGYNVDDGGKNLEANLEKLIQGRGRFMYSSEIEMMQAIEKLGVKESIKIHPIAEEISGRYIAFSKKTPKETIDKVTKALEKLRNSGKLDEIFRRYVK